MRACPQGRSCITTKTIRPDVQKSLFAVYDRRSIFNYLSNKGMNRTRYWVRKSSSSKARCSIARKLVVIEQLADYDR